MPQASIYLDERARQEIRLARNQRKLSLPALAELCKLSLSMMQAIELGNKRPSADALGAICKALDLQWEQQSAAVYPRPPRTAKVGKKKPKG